jgi:putative membrane protein insertion efficiency factor
MLPSPTLKPISSGRWSVAWKTLARRVDATLVAGLLVLLRAYKLLLSPLFTGSCRFYPSCSDYMAEAVRIHGPWRGVWLGCRRLLRCRPLGGHGVDPVPHS